MQLYEELRSHFYIPDAYRHWKRYRDLLSAYLSAEADNGSTLAILGAGACNDIDLSYIRQYFSEITLIDYDDKAMKEAVKRYRLEQDLRVELCPAGLTGIGESGYVQFCTAMQQFAGAVKDGVPVQALDAFAISALRSVAGQGGSCPLEGKKYDCIWCVGVHSQLHVMFSYIYRVFWENLYAMGKLFCVPEGDGPEDSAFTAYLQEFYTEQIRQLHEDILKAAGKKVFIGCELGRTNAYYDGMHRAAQNVIGQSPVCGAYQGILDIRSRNLSVEEGVLCWPFYPENAVYYDMLIQKIEIGIEMQI